MLIKFRCPHCFKTLTAEAGAVGQPKPCPACGRIMHVPTSIEAAAAEQRAVRTACPQCKTEAAPTATFCWRCFTVFATGKRMPWRERLSHLSWQHWAIVVGGGAVVLLVLSATIQFARIHLHRPTTRPAVAMGQPDVDAGPLVAGLLGASSETERRAALAALLGIELRAMSAVSAGLDEAFAGGTPTLEQTRNRLAAIELMVRHRDADARVRGAWIETLKHCDKQPALRSAGLRARALLDDSEVIEPLVARWLGALDRALFLERISALMPADALGAKSAAKQARQEADRLADGLRYLGRGDDRAVFENVAARTWSTWGWLAQHEGLAAARELFDLARPADPSLRFDPADIRRPRDVMRQLAESGAADVRSAAALALINIPQYRTLAERIMQTMARVARDADAADQQRLVWVISQLRGKRFTQRELGHPLDVTAAEIAAAQTWVDAASTPVLRSAYPEPPRLTYRAVTPRRQLAAELGRRLAGDWRASSDAIDLWLTARLGITPPIREMLNPAQREPHMPGLAGALVIAGVAGGAEERRVLELWRDAREQPAWVRALASTALARIDLRADASRVSWPRGLDVGPAAALDAKTPGWEHFGRIIAAGGPAMRDLLSGPGGRGLPTDVRAKLLGAATRAMEREAAVGAP